MWSARSRSSVVFTEPSLRLANGRLGRSPSSSVRASPVPPTPYFNELMCTGCGIGVLLRMFWVFFVLIFRGIREESSNTADAEYTLVLAHVDETLPKYVDQVEDVAPAYIDEKTEPPTGA